MLQPASATWVGGMVTWEPSLAALGKGLLLGLIAYFIALAVYRIARSIAGWGDDSPVPQSRALWMGPDLIETTEAARALVDALRQAHGLEPLNRHPATDELAQHHAYDMAERSFCSPIDPDGIDLSERLVRLHPTMVARLCEWENEVHQPGAAEPGALARELLGQALNTEQSLAELALADSLNCMGISVAGSGSRATICIVFAHHWATLIRGRPPLEREGTWPVAAELTDGIKAEELSAALVENGCVAGPQVRAENFSDGEWQDNRVYVYMDIRDNMDAARLQWYRLSAASVPLPML